MAVRFSRILLETCDITLEGSFTLAFCNPDNCQVILLKAILLNIEEIEVKNVFFLNTKCPQLMILSVLHTFSSDRR